MDESQIIQGCKSGDRRCQEALVHKFAPRLLAVCRRYCIDQTLAEDALQETFMNTFRYISSYSGTGSFEGWLRRIAVTKSLEINKKFLKINLFPIESEINPADVVIPDIYSTLGEKEIQLLLEKLPKNQYIVFNLFVVEGYSHQEIGEILSLAEGSSRALLSRARSSLISMMENQYQYKRYPLAHL
ncbi:MAG: sigma-70 family RNA polymerase sigma factor [Saprospiraceae bacterium]|nr:sigma-70 family RNA polymerase sigma factor [Saprospiraceae bacterium]MBK8548977.1 sigma-70 family RNA polymerase sigma factor [Saprospiraceae bacterium]MBK9043541.1 sigma-70 family RNA polymerase sigma factor [Saprospiraceae bacterium]MBP6695046.1 sigma-70 family RNA polymerase sigma factor [Saprospiraceae bacterium]